MEGKERGTELPFDEALKRMIQSPHKKHEQEKKMPKSRKSPSAEELVGSDEAAG